MGTLLSKISVRLDAQIATKPYVSPVVTLASTTTTVTIRLARWDEDATVGVALVLRFADGSEHRHRGQASGGVKLGLNDIPITEYVMRVGPTTQVRRPTPDTVEIKTIIEQTSKCEAWVELDPRRGVVTTLMTLEAA